MQITEKLRSKILLSLPKGYAKTVAVKCGVSEVTVYRVLHHGQDHFEVAEALINLAAETKAEKVKNHRRVLEIAKQL
ncbi:MAG TPA: hypothetical protein VK589_11840 [Chryseolinea sp.]|nr:hypothetical protein [Chryseolinea sp.]